MLGPYIKSRGTGVTKMSANADITVEPYVQQEKTIENQFCIIWVKNVKKKVYFWLFKET